jgi:uncharacterized protein YwgA
MDKRQIGLKLALDALGLPPRLDTFDTRLIVQKAIYLAQVRGFDLGYHFSWYLRGPYSSQLAADAFAVVTALDSGADESKGWRLEENAYQLLKNVAAFWARDGISASWLEVLASVHFLVSRSHVLGDDVNSIRSTLIRFGKNFEVQTIKDALVRLQEAEILEASPAPA